MNTKFDISFAKELDFKDSLFKHREKFHIPKHKDSDSIYFTGNSLGLQLKNQSRYLNESLEDWRSLGVEGHFHAKTPWYDYHKTLTANVSSLVGAEDSEVVTMNSLSVNLHLLLILKNFEDGFGL